MAKHILIVDDEPNFRFSAGIALKKEGYEISEAENGKEAFTMIMDAQKESRRFDLLLLDVQMPGMSGIELIKKLKKNSILVPILVVSAFPTKEHVAELVLNGCLQILSKPFEPSVLLKRVEEILERYEKQA